MKEEYEIATCWDDVTLEMFIKIQEINKSEFTPAKQLVSVLSVLMDCPIEKLYQMNLEILNTLDISFLQKEIPKAVDTVIEIDGIRYGMVKDMKKLSLGEYVDLDYYTHNIDDNFHNIVGILMRPVIQEDGEMYMIEKYDGDNLEARANIFLKKMKVSQLINTSNFFLNSVNGFLENMKPYLTSVKK